MSMMPHPPPSPMIPQGPRTSRVAIASLVMGVAAALGIPMLVVLGVLASSPRDVGDVVGVLCALGGVCMLTAIGLAVASFVTHTPGDTKGKLFGILGLVAGLLSPIVIGVVSVVGLFFAAGGGPHGRPLRRKGVPVLPDVDDGAGDGAAASAWSVADDVVRGLTLPEDPEVRQELAEGWLLDARTEHASVATFALLAEDLLCLGAPPELLVACQRAAIDEVHHARIAYAIASFYAGRTLAPAPYTRAAREPSEVPSPARLAREALLEGVVGEGACAAALAVAAREAEDPVLARHLARLATDEGRHAAFARDLVAYLVGREPALAAELSGALTGDLPEPSAPSADLRAYGRFSPETFRAAVEACRQEAARFVSGLRSGEKGAARARGARPSVRPEA